MKTFFFVLFLTLSLFSNEFVVKRSESSSNETRATLREKIACCAGGLLDNTCLCIRREIKKVSWNKNKDCCGRIDIVVDLQQEFLSMIRDIFDQQKCWKRVARSELYKLNEFLTELNEVFLDEHNVSWWKEKHNSLKKMIPQS